MILNLHEVLQKLFRDFSDVVTHKLLSNDLREQIDTWNVLSRARNEGRLFSRIEWPKDPEIIEQAKRLHLLLTVKDSAANIPKNLEARRKLEFVHTNASFAAALSAPTACKQKYVPTACIRPSY